MRSRTTSFLAAFTAALFVAIGVSLATPAASSAVGISIASTTTVVATTTVAATQTVDVAEARALELEKQIEELNAESVAISERISVTSLRIYLQQRDVDQSKQRLESARSAYQDRMVALYKSGESSLVLLLGSSDLSDFVARFTYLTRISDVDRRALEDAIVESAEANFQASQLEDLRAQDVELRQLQDDRIAQTSALLTEQQQLVATLSAQAKAKLEEARRLAAEERKRWFDSSIPITAKVSLSNATVDIYPGTTWKVAYYQPKRYHATGLRYTYVCSWYGNEFHGRKTASGQIYNQEDLTCASRDLPFGTRLALTRGDKRVIVVVNDRGPFVAGRDLDLSRAAARILGFSGVEPVQAEIVEPLN